jgi:prolyl oligopeptidase
MKPNRFSTAALSAIVVAVLHAVSGQNLVAAEVVPPPPSEIAVVGDTLHGVVVEDPYRWLEDQEAPATRAWITTQNAYTEQVMADAPNDERLRARLEELMKVENVGVPFERGGRYFYTRRKPDQELSLLCMRQGLEGAEQVVVDPHPLSADGSISVGFASVSQDGRLAAYTLRTGGEDEVEIAFRDLETGRDLTDRLPRARYFGVSFRPDRSGVFFTRHTRQGPRVYEHAFGADPAQDPVVFGEGYGPEMIVSSSLSSNGHWQLFTVNRGSTGEHTELYVRNLQEGGPIRTVVNDLDASFTGKLAGDRLFVETNWNAPNHRVLEVDLRAPARERWREVVPEGRHAIQSFSIVGGKLFVNLLENVVSVVRIFDLAGKSEGRIAFPTLGSVGEIGGQWDRDEAFFTFSSFHVPTTIYRYQVGSRRRSEWWRSPAPVQSDRFVVEQVWFQSKDGTRVPMFVAHKKGLARDGSNPTLLTGYGGFSSSQRPAFTPRAALWMEEGGVYALPNLRGGDEFGEPWHRAGMLARKQNVFDDFIAAAEWLVANRYTRRDRLAIAGRSNGGLLVGAALTQRPDLFGAVVCGFPLLDMVRYHRFLVARYWVPEYGSADDSVQFRTLHAYSPYHHVRPGESYPAVLFVTGDSDTRVAPLHARKMVARLQAANAFGRPILLRYDTRSGHVTGKPIAGQVDDLAAELRFLFWQLGVAPRAPSATRAGAGS